jgi:hypothetical protein
MPPPHTNIYSGDHVICENGSVLILSYGGANSLFALRRSAQDGALRRFVESPLPPTNEDWGFIDIATVRESASAIIFDRVGVQFKDGEDRFMRRESFEIPLHLAGNEPQL